MLFMGGQQRPTLDDYSDKYRDDESQERQTTQANLRNIGLAITGFYILVSLISVAFLSSDFFSFINIPDDNPDSDSVCLQTPQQRRFLALYPNGVFGFAA